MQNAISEKVVASPRNVTGRYMAAGSAAAVVLLAQSDAPVPLRLLAGLFLSLGLCI